MDISNNSNLTICFLKVKTQFYLYPNSKRLFKKIPLHYVINKTIGKKLNKTHDVVVIKQMSHSL